MSFLFVKGYVAAKFTFEFDWSIVHGSDWVAYTWNMMDDLSVEAHAFVCGESCLNISVFPESVVVSVWFERFTCTDSEVANRYYRG